MINARGAKTKQVLFHGISTKHQLHVNKHSERLEKTGVCVVIYENFYRFIVKEKEIAFFT